jgi:hypothetical protein
MADAAAIGGVPVSPPCAIVAHRKTKGRQIDLPPSLVWRE